MNSLKDLTPQQKIALLNKFADFRRRQGDTSIILQSLPSYGVHTNKGFYSLESIFEAVKGKLKGGNNVSN